ncbi:UrcA family protein [Rhizorhapis suberifaciens]|uniref:UrcA family protein n=1 Tax=Rhizorhapis suberifaciens TaxID=13656 RepID=A0A840HUN9_9SPHN|nr:UrcA family protein [Rhizorhapis suberifaciens]MBB4641745.1 UrcA family protein [Rhizorhapis suberifaciens]
MIIPHFPSAARGLCLGVAIAALTSPVLAQNAPEEIIVSGRYGKVPDSVQSLSQPVSYADLDLSKDSDRKILRQRISLTARFLCDKLGEPATAAPPAPSCRDAAVADAMRRVDTTEAGFAPRGTTWVRGQSWKAPYPEDWPTKYP